MLIWIINADVDFFSEVRKDRKRSVASFIGQLTSEDRFYKDLYLHTTYRTKEGRIVVALSFESEYSTNLNLCLSRKDFLLNF